MKIMKKFSKVMIAAVLCLLLATTAWATEKIIVSYTAELDTTEFCLHTAVDRTVTLTAKAGERVDMDAFTAQVKAPDGWKIKGISNEKFGEELQFNLANGMLLWYSDKGENVSNDLLAQVTVEVPEGVSVGEYELVFEIIDISRDWGMPWENGKVLTATLNVSDHNYGDDGKCSCGAEKPADPTDPTEPVDVLKGDVNLDGVVDMNDLVAMARHIGEVEELTDPQSLANGELDGDGEVGMTDLIKLAQFVGEIIDSL